MVTPGIMSMPPLNSRIPSFSLFIACCSHYFLQAAQVEELSLSETSHSWKALFLCIQKNDWVLAHLF